MKKSFTLLCSIFLIGSVLNGCTQNEAPDSSTTQSSKAASSSVQSIVNQNITLEKDQISKDVVFRKTSAADGEIVLTSDRIEKIEMKPSQTAQNPNIYDITFYLTEEGRKQFSKGSREIAEANEEMSIWGKDGKVSSGKIEEPIEGGIFVLSGSYSFEEAKQHLESFSSDSDIIG